MMSNDNWNDTPATVETMTALGAFALMSNSKDSVVLPTLPADGYSVRISAAGGATSGVALAEIYDADTGTPEARLVNVSTRGFVGTGENVLAAGFVIEGSRPKQLLIRAVGPGLIPHGVTGVLADPQFSIVPTGSTTAIASSNDWGSGGAADALGAIFAKVYAFALTAGSKDAALIVQLPGGGYSVVVSGVGGTTGNALVEIYDLEP
jgi:hypothetical protein